MRPSMLRTMRTARRSETRSRMHREMRSPMRAVCAIAGALILLAGCVSPEAQRARGGGAGADVGNRTPEVKLHGGSRMYSRTPCLLPERECPGPLPSSGLPGDFPAPRPTRR
jgi:hypothetical protein